MASTQGFSPRSMYGMLRAITWRTRVGCNRDIHQTTMAPQSWPTKVALS